MIREEAKEIISRHHWAFASMDDEVIEAIECLAEECEDTISRAWLKEAIHNFYYGLKHTPTEEDIQAYIDVAPSVTPTCSLKPNNCEDAISRDYLLSIANTDGAYGYVSAHDIAKAPSVTPKQKMGRWIDREVYDADRWKCSECGRTEPYKENFCPNCGCQMEESEEKESE